MKRIASIFMLFVLASAPAVAQNADNPWLVSLGINATSIQSDFTSPLNNGISYTQDNFESFDPGKLSLSVFRAVTGGLSLGAQLNVNGLRSDLAGLDFFAADLAAKYGFNREGKFSPFVKAGWGFSSFDGADGDIDFSRSLSNTYFGGIGVNYQISKRLSLFAETSYRSTQDNPEVNYVLHSAGIAYGLGSGDTDRDGVSDKKDKCPDVPGLKEFDGCPDTDEDGIPDPEDDCPENAGPEENKGCPDTDGDGVLDKDDTCPEVAGLVELAGCPDADADGIADQDDTCPDAAGPAENKGCPWPDTDSDGVLDKDDDCPEMAGTSANGCPEITDAILATINQIGSNILFPVNGTSVSAESMEALNEIKAIFDATPVGRIVIEGHGSKDGNEDYNLKLSLKRAESVRDELIKLGVDASRLDVKAMGESQPMKGDLNTAKNNRRVEFYRI